MTRGFVLQPGYRVVSGRAVVQLFGRLEDGPAFQIEDDRFRPYFFVRTQDARLLEGARDVRIEPTELRDLSGEPVARVEVGLPGAVPPLRERLRAAGAEALEADVRFPYRYLIDHGLRGGVEIEGTPETLPSGLVRFHNPELAPADVRPRLRALSLDLETTPDASRIFSIAFVSEDIAECHLVHDGAVPGATTHADERKLLAAAADRLRQIDPDVLLGWNVVDFDLRVWARRCQALGLPCQLGRVPGDLVFRQDQSFTRQSRADLPGRMVLDGIPLVRDALRLPDYRLETVAQAVLGRGKLLDAEAPDSAAEISRLFHEDPAALVRYNVEDARLVLEILEREGLLALCVERSLLSGMQLDRVGASIASFDGVMLPELRRRGLVAPSVDAERKSAGVRGGAVLDSKPGLFTNVAVFDFRSLYPSLIQTFQLDPLARARAGEDAIVAPNGARFSREEAILPAVIERFMASRAEAKARGDRHADQAIKIMTNALFGVLGAGACRFFDPEIANAITSFGQQTLHWTEAAFEAEGVRVLYGDTDSVFVELETREPGGQAREEAERLRERVEHGITSRIRREYGVEPRLDLELEVVFDRFFMPRVRKGTSGSKKRYAGWSEGQLVIIGLESVRRDWPGVARRLQEGVLERVFTERPVLPFVRELVAQVQAGERDRELVYVKRVRKGDLERYASAPPHVQAARKAGPALRGIVHYVITHEGPEPVLPGRPLPAGIDHRHYVERVLRPVADAILPFVGTSFDEALGDPTQLALL